MSTIENTIVYGAKPFPWNISSIEYADLVLKTHFSHTFFVKKFFFKII